MWANTTTCASMDRRQPMASAEGRSGSRRRKQGNRMNDPLGTSSLIASPLAGLGERFWLELPTLKGGANNLCASGATKSEPDPSIDSFHAIALALEPGDFIPLSSA